MRKTTTAVILILWTLAGLYFGLGGWVWSDLAKRAEAAENEPDGSVSHGNLTFRNKALLEVFLDEENASQLFPWPAGLPRVVLLSLTSCCFGALGGVIRLVSELVLKKQKVTLSNALVMPFFGFLMGLLLLGLSILVPTALVVDKVDVDPNSLFFICLFGGAFSDRTFEWIRGCVSKLFGSDNEDSVAQGGSSDD